MLNEKFFELANREDSTALTANESKAVESLRKEYGNELANSAKTILSLDKAVNGTHIIKAYSIVNAINKYNSTCANPKKQRSARTAFSNATGISSTDISRYFSIVTLIDDMCDVCVDSFAPKVYIGDEKDVEKFILNAVESYLTKFDYIKVVELAKMKVDDIAYIIEKSKNDLPNYSKAELIFILDSFRLEVIPKHGCKHEYDLRVDWLAKGKKIKDYDNKVAPVQNDENKTEDENKSNEPENNSKDSDNKSNENDNKSNENDNKSNENDNKSNENDNKSVEEIANDIQAIFNNDLKSIADVSLFMGKNDIGKIADSTTWNVLFYALEKIGVMDIFTKFAEIYCKNNNIESPSIDVSELDGNIIADGE